MLGDRVRPDFSEYVAHFTRGGSPLSADEKPDDAGIKAVGVATPYERLVSILEQRRIFATPMPWTGRRAVAFTECPWGSMPDHAEQYSPYGVGFTKPHLFAAGGGPAVYLRADLFEKQRDFVAALSAGSPGFCPHLYSFVTPFSPPYSPADYREHHWKGKADCDYTHEREWRVPHDFTFDYGQVQFVVVRSYEDVAAFPKALKDEIGRQRFLIMDVYEQIEKLWPVHII